MPPVRSRKWLQAAPRALALALFLFLLAVYLLSYSPRFHSSDGLAMFSMAESLARRGETDIDQIRWMGLQQGTFGLDGHLYSRKGAGTSLLLLPLVWVGLLVPVWGPATTALLFNSIVTAATASVLFLAVTRLGYDQRVALASGLIFGLSTLAWPYVKTDFSDPLAGLCLVIAFLALLRFRDLDRPLDAGVAGLALSVALATRYVNVALLPLFGLLLLWYTQRDSPAGRGADHRLSHNHLFNFKPGTWSAVGSFVVPIVIAAVLIAYFNLTRYGNPLSTGYLPEESFSGAWGQGIVGLLVSPGRGLFLYSPVLLLVLPATPTFFRRHRPEAVLILSVIAAHLLIYGKWFMWHGGYAWGPRFLVPTLTFWVMLMTPAIVWSRKSVWWKIGLWGLALLSSIIQILGLSVHYELFLNQLLDTGYPLYAPITFFAARYSPLLGQIQYLVPENLDFGWIEQGQVDWFLLAGLLVTCLIAAWALVRAARHSELPRERRLARVFQFMAILALVLTASWLLTRVHQRWPVDMRNALHVLNIRAGVEDAIVTAAPEETVAFADLYQERADVLGLSNGSGDLTGEARDQVLADLTAQHELLWWFPNWLPAEQSGIEQWLLRNGFRAQELFFPREEDSPDGRRLVLFYFPPEPLSQITLLETYGGEITLLEADLLSQEHPARVLPVRLHWRADRPVSEDYHVFVHLLDAGANMVAHSDGQPVLWSRPTSTWSVGETIEDRHALVLPDDLMPGTYALVAGLYLPQSGERLLTDEGEDFVKLDTIQLTED